MTAETDNWPAAIWLQEEASYLDLHVSHLRVRRRAGQMTSEGIPSWSDVFASRCYHATRAEVEGGVTRWRDYHCSLRKPAALAPAAENSTLCGLQHRAAHSAMRAVVRCGRANGGSTAPWWPKQRAERAAGEGWHWTCSAEALGSAWVRGAGGGAEGCGLTALRTNISIVERRQGCVSRGPCNPSLLGWSVVSREVPERDLSIWGSSSRCSTRSCRSPT